MIKIQPGPDIPFPDIPDEPEDPDDEKTFKNCSISMQTLNEKYNFYIF